MGILKKVFGIGQYDMEIKIPSDIEVIMFDDKVRFKGNSENIIRFGKNFWYLAKLKDGQLCKLGRYTLKVSDYKTEDQFKENWIELPSRAWGIMGSKFIEAADEQECNPFDFNDCGFIRIPFDIGVEVTDLPIVEDDYGESE